MYFNGEKFTKKKEKGSLKGTISVPVSERICPWKERVLNEVVARMDGVDLDEHWLPDLDKHRAAQLAKREKLQKSLERARRAGYLPGRRPYRHLVLSTG